MQRFAELRLGTVLRAAEGNLLNYGTFVSGTCMRTWRIATGFGLRGADDAMAIGNMHRGDVLG